MTQATSNGPNVAMREPEKAAANPDLAALLARPITVPVKDGAFAPDSIEAYQRIAKGYIVAGMVPRGLEGPSPDATLARVTMCLEAGSGLGLSCSQAMQNIMVVNNRPAVWGDAIPALIRASGKCVQIAERLEGTGDAATAVCEMVRLHPLPDGTFERETIRRTFSVADAKRAGLWGKTGPWTNYPARMMGIRARAFCGRDGFADVLMGFGVVEELQDTPGADTPSADLQAVRERVAALPQTPAPAATLPPVTAQAPQDEPTGAGEPAGEVPPEYAGGVTEAELDAVLGPPSKPGKQGAMFANEPTTVKRGTSRPK